MGLLKDVSQSLLKYGEVVVDKTENLTRSARLKIEIRKKESEIEKIKFEIGDTVASEVKSGKTEFSANDGEISRHLKSIEELNREIEELRAKSEAEKDTSTDADADKQAGSGGQS